MCLPKLGSDKSEQPKYKFLVSNQGRLGGDTAPYFLAMATNIMLNLRQRLFN